MPGVGDTGLIGRVVIGAVASQLSGGKAQNGALSAAFEYLFNQLGRVTNDAIDPAMANGKNFAQRWLDGFMSDPTAQSQAKAEAKDAAVTTVKSVGYAADGFALWAKHPVMVISGAGVSGVMSGFEFILTGDEAPIVGFAVGEWIGKSSWKTIFPIGVMKLGVVGGKAAELGYDQLRGTPKRD